ncbi:MAG: hypothetical protein K0S88_3598 [Actinomycetia bacterium]|nr:hypothetical protein [Actinomycetes bacterium]
MYVGGDFKSAEGAGRRHLAAFNATSGAISKTFKPELSNGAGNFATVLAMDVSPDGDTLYFAGDFALVNGTSRRNAAAVSTGIAALRAWSPASSGDIAGDLVLSPSGRTVFVAGRAAGGYVQAYGPTAGGARCGTWPPTATWRRWPSSPRPCAWAATSPASAAPTAATWPPSTPPARC